MDHRWAEFLGVGFVFDVLASSFMSFEIGRKVGGDVNADGVFTMSDVLPALLSGFAGPGHLIIDGLGLDMQRFLEYDGSNGILPVLLALLVWAGLACFVAWVSYQVRYTIFGPLPK